MKKIPLVIFYILLITNFSFSMDEATYANIAADSVITAYKAKGSPNSMNLWMSQMKKKYPSFQGAEWQEFEGKLKSSPQLKKRVYNEILNQIRSKGYDARIVNLGEGKTIIEITN